MTELVGASPADRALYDYIDTHIEGERAILEEYRTLASGTRSPALNYIAELILADEQRHHAFLVDLAATVKAMAEMSQEAPIPPLRAMNRDPRLADTVQRFIDIERHDLDELKALSRRLKDYKDTTLWATLIDSMQDDTRKHIRLLKFARDRLRKGIV